MASYLFGQMIDPNIQSLVPYFDKFIDQNSDLYWDLQTNVLTVDDEPVTDIDSIFLRASVFEEQTHLKYNNYYLMRNYVACNEDIKIFNRNHLRETPYKLYNLKIAMDVGLNIPYTEVSKKAKQSNETILKPITGGRHTEIGREASYPVIIQQRIKHKNKRLYIINDKHFCFDLVTDKVDYRDDEESYVVVSNIPDDQLQKVKKVMKKVGLNFTAADFMIDEENKHWFLEVNTLPMFAAFDVVVNGTLAKTIRDELDLI